MADMRGPCCRVSEMSPCVLWLLAIMLTVSLAQADNPPSWACEAAPLTDYNPNPTPACADATCAPQQARLGGELRVISYDTMSMPHHGIYGDDPVECCSICKGMDFCNVWGHLQPQRRLWEQGELL